MKKSTKESVIAISVVVGVFMSGVICGWSFGYDEGLSEGMAISDGDKWDCAYSASTGFLMCDRTQKYK